MLAAAVCGCGCGWVGVGGCGEGGGDTYGVGDTCVDRPTACVPACLPASTPLAVPEAEGREETSKNIFARLQRQLRDQVVLPLNTSLRRILVVAPQGAPGPRHARRAHLCFSVSCAPGLRQLPQPIHSVSLRGLCG